MHIEPQVCLGMQLAFFRMIRGLGAPKRDMCRLLSKDDFGLNVAISNAKRAVCRRIDALISYNHLIRLRSATYPETIVGDAPSQGAVPLPAPFCRELNILRPRISAVWRPDIFD